MMGKSEYVRVQSMKVGDRYFFVDTNFHYVSVPAPVIRQRTIYRIVGVDFSTKEEDDRFEVIRVIAHRTKEEAKKEAIRDLRRYKAYMSKAIDSRIAEITNPPSNSSPTKGGN